QKWLISKERGKEIAIKVGERAIPSSEISYSNPPKKESEETTHYSIIDSFGNAVSVTTTLNSTFGNKIVVDGAGFIMNNEMDDFSAKPGVPNQFGLLGNKANSIEPNKRMLSAMTPTIVLNSDKILPAYLLLKLSIHQDNFYLLRRQNLPGEDSNFLSYLLYTDF
ncbi:MAG: Gamma-glutamyltransferase, partial [Candidatus Daviesbacteria bacterium GW2011_GWF2_38_7]